MTRFRGNSSGGDSLIARLRKPLRRPGGGYVTVGVVITALGAMVATLFGIGAVSRAVDLNDGNVWLWSGDKGEAVRVNAASGQVDTRRALPGGEGGKVTVSQSDKNLILRNHDTGTITSINLGDLSSSGAVSGGAGDAMKVALHDGKVLIIDNAAGIVRQVDPATLEPIGTPLRFDGRVVGGVFDDQGRLWLANPGKGSVISIKAGSGGAGPIIDRTVDNIAKPESDLAITALDDGVAVFDGKADVLTKIVGDKTYTVTVKVEGQALISERTRGDVITITDQDKRRVYVIDGEKKPVSIKVAGKGKIETSLAFSGRIYITDNAEHLVRVYGVNGGSVGEITIPESAGDVALETREGYLFVNAPSSARAWVVNAESKITPIDKAPADVIGGEDTQKPENNQEQQPGPEQPNEQPNPELPEIPLPELPNPNQGPDPTTVPVPDPEPTQEPPPPPPPAPNTPPPSTPDPVPGAPVNVAANVISRGTVELSWQPPTTGSATGYVVRLDGGVAVNVGSDVRSHQFTGLADGSTVTLSVAAVNESGEGAGVSVQVSLWSKPTVQITGNSKTKTTITVNLSASSDGGGAVKCTASTKDGDASGSCDELTVEGLTPGTSYKVTVKATNDIGEGTDSVTVKTADAAEKGTVVCENGPDAPNDDYCTKIRTFDCASQQNCTDTGGVKNGDRFTGTCKDTGNVEITAYMYNDYKTSDQWIKLTDGRYIPYVWFNLDDGSAAMKRLPKC